MSGDLFDLSEIISAEDAEDRSSRVKSDVTRDISLLPDLSDPKHKLHNWKEAFDFLAEKQRRISLQDVKTAIRAYPTDADLLLLACFAALFENRPDDCQTYRKRFIRRYVSVPLIELANAIALAQKGAWEPAAGVLDKHHSRSAVHFLPTVIPGGHILTPWAKDWVTRIDREVRRRALTNERQIDKAAAMRASARAAKTARGGAKQPTSLTRSQALEIAATAKPREPGLTRLQASMTVSFDLPKSDLILLPDSDINDERWFALRSEYAHFSLLQGFDELLCLPVLQNVTSYWYQIETVRKVLKQFRGRVLLADEVGLGKTIEAGMVLKEYVLRGMADRILILTPASMVGQWMEEMTTKFGIDFLSSADNQIRRDPASFWKEPRVIASIALARRREHQQILRELPYDIVVVDEAHHLKDRGSTNWKLVDSLQKRFLLLLTATPVQNSLIELFNLLTLLKPGVFKTEREFRTTYVTPGKPRIPANREHMRDLMRDVMIRNTRANVDVRLPSRNAITLKIEPTQEEADCYRDLSNLISEHHRDQTAGRARLGLRHLLSAAGSSSPAAAKAIQRFTESNNVDERWKNLASRYRAISRGAKENTLLDLLRRNPEEKKIVFLRHLDTLASLDALLRKEDIRFERFSGSMSGPEKNGAIERFSKDTPVLLSTESGGEGRNLQFSNTLINFDLPWNPMAIEQRIGRLHRIGQTREVFIFNLAVRNTLEEYLLRILDEKINMFQLVVGEIGAILGEMDGEQDFSEMIFAAWIESTEHERALAFETLGEQVVQATRKYEGIKVLDEHLFGDEFITA
ncbi:MAG: hypothetical protein DMF61_21735 [Blastocatellia bacterium AA13]|nr:MAG: hypothetical protein DMF61_21735 [Blastocatellia bacterium AA13]